MKLFGFCSQIPLKHLKHFQLLIPSWMIRVTYKLLNSTVKAAIYLLIYTNLFCSISMIPMDQTAFNTAMHFHIQQMQMSCPILLCPPATLSIKDMVTQHLHCIQPMAPSASSIEGSATPLMLALLWSMWTQALMGRTRTFIEITPHTPLSEQDNQHNLYASMPGFRGLLVYSMPEHECRHVIIEPIQIQGHVVFQDWPASTYGIAQETRALIHSCMK